MAAAIDIDAYFRRIDYAGERAPTLDTLRALHVRHPVTLPAAPELDAALERLTA